MGFRPTEDRAMRRVHAESIVTQVMAKYPRDEQGTARRRRAKAAQIVRKYRLYK